MPERCQSLPPPPPPPSSLSCLDRWLAAIENVEAIPPVHAARKLRVHPTTVYRWLRHGDLEAILRKGKSWVTVRSILHFTTNSYGPTTEFNALSEFLKTCTVCGKCSNQSSQL